MTIQNKKESDVQMINKKLVGISGWLIVPAIGLVLGLIASVANLIFNISSRMPIFELIISSGLIGFIAYTIILFFKKKKNTPKAIILLYIMNIVASYAFIFLDGGVMSTTETTGKLIFDLVIAIIWIIYFKVSKRVMVTFVN